MHRYDLKVGKAEDVGGPSTDEGALEVLSGHPDSGRLVERYVVLREEGLGVGQAFSFVGRRLRMSRPRHPNLGRAQEPQRTSQRRHAVRRKDTRMETLPSVPMGLLSGLEAQGEISELLDELYGDGPT